MNQQLPSLTSFSLDLSCTVLSSCRCLICFSRRSTSAFRSLCLNLSCSICSSIPCLYSGVCICTRYCMNWDRNVSIERNHNETTTANQLTEGYFLSCTVKLLFSKFNYLHWNISDLDNSPSSTSCVQFQQYQVICQGKATLTRHLDRHTDRGTGWFLLIHNILFAGGIFNQAFCVYWTAAF